MPNLPPHHRQLATQFLNHIHGRNLPTMTEETTPKTKRTRNVNPAKKAAKQTFDTAKARINVYSELTTALSNAGVDMAPITPVIDNLLTQAKQDLRQSAEVAYPELCDVLANF